MLTNLTFILKKGIGILFDIDIDSKDAEKDVSNEAKRASAETEFHTLA